MSALHWNRCAPAGRKSSARESRRGPGGLQPAAPVWYKDAIPMEQKTLALRQELKQFIVRRLRLEHVDPAGIGDDAQLVGGGLDLDSIDLLELVVGLEKEYGITIADVAEGRRALATLPSLVDFVGSRRGSS